MINAFDTDVLIVGGGPAGASAALSILKFSELKVTVVEQSDLNIQRIGEQVSSSIFDLLHYLGLDRSDFGNDCFLPGYSSHAAWGTSQIIERHSISSTHIDNYQINRSTFDLTLLAKASERGAVIMPNARCIEYQAENKGWQVTINHQTEGEFIVNTRYLIDATGRQSHLARQLEANITKDDELVAVGAFLEFREEKDLEQDFFVETVEDGWWYYAVLPEKKIVLSLFTDAHIIKKKQLNKIENWTALLLNTVHVKHKVSGTVSTQKLWVKNAYSHFTDSRKIKDFIAIGDAACSFDPISSLGIGFAMSSACNGALAIMNQDKNANSINNYNEDLKRIYDDYINTKSKYYKEEQRWPDAKFWNNRNVGVEGVKIR